MKRSTLFSLLAAAVIVAVVIFFVGIRDEGSTSLTETSAPAAEMAEAPEGAATNADDLLAPGPLPDKVLGDANAPVTVVEYASLSCSHCREFHDTTFPEVKKRYIDTGKVRFIYRDFPLDQFATAGAMLARCSEDNYFAVIDAFFSQQEQLLSAQDPLEWLKGFGKQVGFTEETLEACLSNQELMDNILAVRQRASEKFGVNSTPTFFFNGKIKRGALTIEEFEKEVEPLVKS
jgi:protein-disulfide isomerase